MQSEDTVDRKPEIVSPATPITTPTSNFNPNATILELILKLRSCFYLQESEEVAAILQSREDKLKQNISDLKNREDKLNLNNIELKNQLRSLTNKCTSLEAIRENFAVEKERIEAELKKYEKFAVEKERIEAELKKCKAECEELRDDNFLAKYELDKARLDLKMWREKEVISGDKYEKRIAELEKEKKDESEGMRVENVKLRDEIGGLVDGKKKAEKLATYWEKVYKQVEPEVMKLENDLLMILASYPVLGKSVEELLRSPPVVNPKSVNSGNPELVKRQRQKQSNLSKCDANAHASLCAGYIVNTSGRADAGPNSFVMGAMACGNRMPTENQAVIEIGDSDDENPITETASALKTDKDNGRSCDKDPASQSISRGKRPLVCTQNNGDADGSNKNKKRKLDSAFPNKADEDSYSSDESISNLAIKKLVCKNQPFNFEAEMLTAFNKDDELCLNAVCALHRVQKCDKLPRASQYRGFSAIDAIRGCHLAKFLIDGDPQGKLQKSVVELQEYDSKGIGECRKLARNQLKQLFQIYQKEEDSSFKEYLVKNYPKRTIF